MQELMIFNNPEFGEIRTVEVNGEPWFVLKDVCCAFGESNYRRVSARLDEDEKGVSQIATPGGAQSMTIISEAGLYSALFIMQPEKARGVSDEYIAKRQTQLKKFRRWVTSEVIPSIRKHGAYMTPDTIEKILDDPDTIIHLATALKEERQKRKALEAENEQQRQMIADFEPIKRYVDTILESPGAMATSQIAADYDMSARQLNKILHEEGVQHCVNGQWLLYRRHMGQGYTKSKTFTFDRSDGRQDAKTQTYWTQKGRLWLNEILNRRGIYAIMDRGAVS